jgi:hypothetical protein
MKHIGHVVWSVSYPAIVRILQDMVSSPTLDNLTEKHTLEQRE